MCLQRGSASLLLSSSKAARRRTKNKNMTLQQFGQNAVARYEAKCAAANNAQHNIAGFTWNENNRQYEVTVCGYIVASFSNLSDVKRFSEMHNTTRTA